METRQDQPSTKHGILRRWRYHSAIVFCRRTQDMPRILRKWMRASQVTATTLVVLLILCPAIVDLMIPSGWIVVSSGQELWLGFIRTYLSLALVPLVIGTYWYVGAVRRRVEEHDLLLCTHCGYSLVGLSEQGNCPECGGLFDVWEVRHEWKKWFGALGRASAPRP